MRRPPIPINTQPDSRLQWTCSRSLKATEIVAFLCAEKGMLGVVGLNWPSESCRGFEDGLVVDDAEQKTKLSGFFLTFDD